MKKLPIRRVSWQGVLRLIIVKLMHRLRLPKASFAEWGAIFQNVFINAFTAMLDSPKRQLHISFRSHEKFREILIQDTGHGVNLKNADRAF